MIGGFRTSVPEDKIQALYAAHHGALVRYAAGILGDSSRAEDVVQEAYIRFWSAAKDQLLEQPLAYLYRIVHNLAIDGCRKTQRERSVLTEDRADAGAGLAEAAGDDPTPENILLHTDSLDGVMKAIEELPERTRIALEMHRFGGHKLKDIASVLGISATLAHKLVADGVEHCKKRLGWP